MLLFYYYYFWGEIMSKCFTMHCFYLELHNRKRVIMDKYLKIKIFNIF